MARFPRGKRTSQFMIDINTPAASQQCYLEMHRHKKVAPLSASFCRSADSTERTVSCTTIGCGSADIRDWGKMSAAPHSHSTTMQTTTVPLLSFALKQLQLELERGDYGRTPAQLEHERPPGLPTATASATSSTSDGDGESDRKHDAESDDDSKISKNGHTPRPPTAVRAPSVVNECPKKCGLYSVAVRLLHEVLSKT